MNNFDKALEAAANDEANEGWKWAQTKLKQEDPSIAYEYGVKGGFKFGAHFGIQLVIDELRTNEEFYTSDGDYAQSFADILESKFKGKT